MHPVEPSGFAILYREERTMKKGNLIVMLGVLSLGLVPAAFEVSDVAVREIRS